MDGRNEQKQGPKSGAKRSATAAGLTIKIEDTSASSNPAPVPVNPPLSPRPPTQSSSASGVSMTLFAPVPPKKEATPFSPITPPDHRISSEISNRAITQRVRERILAVIEQVPRGSIYSSLEKIVGGFTVGKSADPMQPPSPFRSSESGLNIFNDNPNLFSQPQGRMLLQETLNRIGGVSVGKLQVVSAEEKPLEPMLVNDLHQILAESAKDLLQLFCNLSISEVNIVDLLIVSPGMVYWKNSIEKIIKQNEEKLSSPDTSKDDVQTLPTLNETLKTKVIPALTQAQVYILFRIQKLSKSSNKEKMIQLMNAYERKETFDKLFQPNPKEFMALNDYSIQLLLLAFTKHVPLEEMSKYRGAYGYEGNFLIHYLNVYMQADKTQGILMLRCAAKLFDDSPLCLCITLISAARQNEQLQTTHRNILEDFYTTVDSYAEGTQEFPSNSKNWIIQATAASTSSSSSVSHEPGMSGLSTSLKDIAISGPKDKLLPRGEKPASVTLYYMLPTGSATTASSSSTAAPASADSSEPPSNEPRRSSTP